MDVMCKSVSLGNGLLQQEPQTGRREGGATRGRGVKKTFVVVADLKVGEIRACLYADENNPEEVKNDAVEKEGLLERRRGADEGCWGAVHSTDTQVPGPITWQQVGGLNTWWETLAGAQCTVEVASEAWGRRH